MGTAHINLRYANQTSEPVCERDCIPLNADSTTIGRSPDADIHLAFAGCRSMEAEVVRRGGRYFLLPLRPTNGTRVNETLLRFRNEIELRHGDRIYVGASELHGFWLEFSCEPEVSEFTKRDKPA